MSKKHFIALADSLRDSRPETHWDLNKATQWRKDVNAIADFCRSHNPRFNRDRWLDYIDGTCGPSGGIVKDAPTEIVMTRG